MRFRSLHLIDLLGAAILLALLYALMVMPTSEFAAPPQQVEKQRIAIELREEVWCRASAEGPPACEAPDWNAIFTRYSVPGRVQSATLDFYGGPGNCGSRNRVFDVGETVELVIPSGEEGEEALDC